MSDTVLVTGGTGYVAGWTIAQLLQQGYTVRTTVRSLGKEKAVRGAVAFAGGGERLSFVATDLMSDVGWDEAVAGCDYVLHVASPLGTSDEGDLVTPAREGALRVLRATAKAGAKRVVMTSSCAACAPANMKIDGESDETVWSDPKRQQKDQYRLSKTLAERAAWDFMEQNGATTELVTVLPAAVFGPVLTKYNLGSVQVIKRMIDGRVPGVPRLGMNVVDVRDVADMHIRAMKAPGVAGQRFIAAGKFMWLGEIAETLHDKLGARGEKVSTRRVADFAVRLAALSNKELRQLTPMLGRRNSFSSAKAQRTFCWTPRPAEETLVACAESLLG